MCAVGDTPSPSLRSLPNCLAVLSAGDGSPSVVSQDLGGIAFLESCYSHCPDGHVPVDVTSSTWFGEIQRLSCQERTLILFRLQSLVLPELRDL